MEQPLGFIQDSSLVCKLKKYLYGLKQAPKAWYEKMDSFLLSLGFSHCLFTSKVYIQRKDNELLILVLYVDDLILTGSSTILIDKVKFDLQQQFDMAYLGFLHYFLGLQVTQYTYGIGLS